MAQKARLACPQSIHFLLTSAAASGVIGNLIIDPDAMTIVGGVIAIAAGLLAIAARLSVVLSSDRLRIRLFPFLTVTLSRAEVRSVSMSRIDVAQLGGIGIRRVRGARVLTMSGGRALRLETAKGQLLVEVHEPDVFVDAVNAWIA